MEKADGSQTTARSRRAAATRREILDAARRLFVANGYTDTTVADIAAEAGVALQTVYSSVGSKAYLLVALLDQSRDDAGVLAIDAAARVQDGPWAVIESGPRVRRVMFEHAGDLLRLLAENAATDPDIRRAWDELLDRSHAGSRTAMAVLDDYGALRPDLSPEVAADLASAIMHPGSVAFLVDRGWSLEDVEAHLVDTLVRALTTLTPSQP